jgi:hypothetical protein
MPDVASARRPTGDLTVPDVHPPQLITGARALYLVWLPADPDGVAALVPEGLTPATDRACYINQYVVDDPAQMSTDDFGAYSLTYLGVDLDGLDAEEGTPARFWTAYLNSSDTMSDYAAARGVPASGGGTTTLELNGDTLVATTFVDGEPLIRTTARVDVGTPGRATGQLRYITARGGGLTSGRYPYVADLAESFEVQSFEFLDKSHPVYGLRPADPLTVTFGFYSPAMTFCYPGGEGELGSAHGS